MINKLEKGIYECIEQVHADLDDYVRPNRMITRVAREANVPTSWLWRLHYRGRDKNPDNLNVFRYLRVGRTIDEIKFNL